MMMMKMMMMMMMMMTSSQWIFRDLSMEVTCWIGSGRFLLCFELKKWTNVDLKKKKEEHFGKELKRFLLSHLTSKKTLFLHIIFFCTFFLFSAEFDLECQTVGFSMRLERCWGGEGFLKLFSCLPACQTLVMERTGAFVLFGDLVRRFWSRTTLKVQTLEVNTWSFLSFPACILV